MFGQVYSRRTTPSIPEPVEDQDSEVSDGTEVTIENSTTHDEHALDIPIALCKGTKECTKNPRYPRSNVVTFGNFSPPHRSFLVNLSNIHIPSTLSEALSNEKWKQAINEEMKALGKNNT